MKKKKNCLGLMLIMAFALTSITACGDTFTGPVVKGNENTTNNYQPTNDSGNQDNTAPACPTCDEADLEKDCDNWVCNGKELSYDSCQELSIPVLIEREDCEWLGDN